MTNNLNPQQIKIGFWSAIFGGLGLVLTLILTYVSVLISIETNITELQTDMRYQKENTKKIDALYYEINAINQRLHRIELEQERQK